MTDRKYEKTAEVKRTYEMLLKKLNPEKHEEKIEKMKTKRQDALTKAQNEIDKTKKEKVNEIKDKFKAKKQELNKEKDQALQLLQSEQSMRRKTQFNARTVSMKISRMHNNQSLVEGQNPLVQGEKPPKAFFLSQQANSGNNSSTTGEKF